MIIVILLENLDQFFAIHIIYRKNIPYMFFWGNFVTIFIHGSINYDYHFIFLQLECEVQDIHVIPNSTEKYNNFSKQTSSEIALRFIATYKFNMNNWFCKQFTLWKMYSYTFFSESGMLLVPRKWIYTYDYIIIDTIWKKLNFYLNKVLIKKFE